MFNTKCESLACHSQEVCESLAAPSLEHALSSCLCAEDARKIEEAVKMAPWESGDTALTDESLLRWWSNIIDDNDETGTGCCLAMPSTGSRDAISQETYEGLFARFVSPQHGAFLYSHVISLPRTFVVK